VDRAFLGGLVGAFAIPGLSSWDILSRPFGTGSRSALMADLTSAKLFKPADRKD
jgi:hypothetical protein